MARRRQNGAQPEARDDDDGQMAFQLPVPSDVQTVAARVSKLKTKMDEVRADLGNVYQDAEEHKHIDRQMLKLALKWAGWDQAKLDSSIAHLNHYLRTLGVEAQVDTAAPGVGHNRRAADQPALA